MTKRTLHAHALMKVESAAIYSTESVRKQGKTRATAPTSGWKDIATVKDMPTYEFKCHPCGITMETFTRVIKDNKVFCPKCGNRMIVMPTYSGYRRDHTIHGDN